MGKEQGIVILGNPVDGFSFIGPFEDRDAAIEYAQVTLGSTDWTVTTISAP